MEIKTHATEVWRLSIVKSLQTPDAPFSHIMFFLLIPNKNRENLWKPPTDKIQIEHLLDVKEAKQRPNIVIIALHFLPLGIFSPLLKAIDVVPLYHLVWVPIMGTWSL